MLRLLENRGVAGARGHLMFRISEEKYESAETWLSKAGLLTLIEDLANVQESLGMTAIEAALHGIETAYARAWREQAGLKTYGRAFADEIARRATQGNGLSVTKEEWITFANGACFREASARARSLGVDVQW